MRLELAIEDYITAILMVILMAFARVCKLRLDSHAQLETRDVAQQISAHCRALYPVSWAALVD